MVFIRILKKQISKNVNFLFLKSINEKEMQTFL
ncbi:hypothetical protein Tfer_2342 [Thermincola ferriacetica]|uniref:Uncharacterized protein n=2 Tax=Thermincola TaxID=278993 RepID=D5XCI9_THEPJ|nr:hypothetical protein TherJR_0748 [Thermincola potens JR]KNZ68982.1 hypothetical protein Tfer_2342 [Thermincola ferriacetica]